jgi:hypothetical protein
MRRSWNPWFLLFLLLPFSAYGQKAATSTSLASNSKTLQLPGSLTLTSTVTPAAGSAGMPSGNVQFFYNGSNSIGTAPLSALPATESFSSSPITANKGLDPYGIFTLPSATSKNSVLGVLDYFLTGVTAVFDEPEVTIYSGQGANFFQTSISYSMSNSGITSSSPGIDAFAIGDFHHNGLTDVLIHGYVTTGPAPTFEYFVLPGVAGGAFSQTNSVTSTDNSGITCTSCFATEVIAVDDFNGDGFPDVAYAATASGSNGLIGVALNGGTSAPASFTTFKTAPTVTVTGQNVSFQPQAIAAGHFTSSGHADLVVSGTFVSTVSKGFLALFPGNGDGTFANPATFATAGRPVAVATADFRKNGTTDVAVANAPFIGTASSIQVFFGNGSGSLALSSTVTYCSSTTGTGAPETPASLLVEDFNNDGFPDILATGNAGSLCLLLNDGTGHFTKATAIGTSPGVASITATGDFNGDGLADIAEITKSPEGDNTASTALELLNSASSQAVLVTAPKTVPAGTDTLTATFPSDANLAASTSKGIQVTVTQTTPAVIWPAPAPIEYGVPLGSTQLDATANVAGAFAYAPAAGTVLAPGANKVTAVFVPTDSFDYTGASAAQTITVTAPSLTGVSPSSAKLGAANTTIAVSGKGLVKGAVVEWNGTALATTWVSLNELTAVVPASLLTSPGAAKVTVADPNKIAVAGSETFTVIAQDAVAAASAKATVEAGQDASLTLTVNPYPVPIAATLKLRFTPEPPNTVIDPTVLFANNTTTDVIQIPANSSAAIPPIDFSTGSTAGAITITITLNADGADVTPASLAPIAVVVPAAPPVISSATLSSSGTTLTVAILGLSSTRDMTQATFHFTPAAGQTLTTTDLTVDLSSAFSTWYGSAGSDRFGTTFLYTQPFTLSTDANSVGSVSVTLTNSKGDSQPSTAQ